MDDEPAARRPPRSRARSGYLDGASLAEVFAWLRPNDLVWNYWVNNYLLGKHPPAFDILYWNADTTRMPAGAAPRLHRARRCGNALVHARGGDRARHARSTFHGHGRHLRHRRHRRPHLRPWQTCYRTTQLLGGEAAFVLSTSGHIAALVNPPGNPKSTYRVATSCPTTRRRGWRRRDARTPGPGGRTGPPGSASARAQSEPRRPSSGSAAHPTLCAAPGTLRLRAPSAVPLRPGRPGPPARRAAREPASRCC